MCARHDLISESAYLWLEDVSAILFNALYNLSMRFDLNPKPYTHRSEEPKHRPAGQHARHGEPGVDAL